MTLNDVCILIADCPHSTAPDEGSGYPLIRTPNIGKGRLKLKNVHRVSPAVYRERNKRAVPQPDDLILAREAPVGNVAIVKEGQQVCLGQRTVLLRPDPEAADPRFLAYYLLSPNIRHAFLGASSGTVVSHLNIAAVKNTAVALPAMAVQKRIASVFSALDEKLDVNDDIASALERYIALLYKTWFADFDFPDAAGRPYRSGGGSMTETDGEMLPSGWAVDDVLRMVEWVGNSQPPKSDFIFAPREGYVRLIQNRDYDSDAHITYIPQTKKLKLADEFDILIDKYGDAGRVRWGIAGAPNVALGKLQAIRPELQEYLRSYFQSDKIYAYLHAVCMASTRASLSRDNLLPLKIVVPEKAVLQRFQNTVRPIREYLLCLQAESKKLENTKLELIDTVFSDL